MTIPSIAGTSYSTSLPPSALPRKILSFVVPCAASVSSWCTSACALEAISLCVASSLIFAPPQTARRARQRVVILKLALFTLLLSTFSLPLIEQVGQVLRHRLYLSLLHAHPPLLVLLDDEVYL